jgi:PBP1b-binding outer membrane lipoprotein LpoB
MFILMLLAEYIIHSKNIDMIKSLFMLTLMLNSCASGNENNEARQDTLNKLINEQPQTNVTSKKEMVDSNFLSFWKEFTDVAKSKNQQAFVTMSFDSLECEGKNLQM